MPRTRSMLPLAALLVLPLTACGGTAGADAMEITVYSADGLRAEDGSGAAGLVKAAPHAASAKKFLDYLLTDRVQREVSAVGGGFPSRTDVKATDLNATALTGIMRGVEIFQPDWADLDKNLPSYVEAWKTATGS